MLKSDIPHDYIEIEEIIKKIHEKDIVLFLNTQNNEGVSNLLNSLINNLLKKEKKIAFIDLNTLFVGKHLLDETMNSNELLKMSSNSFKSSKSDLLKNLTIYHFTEQTLTSEDHLYFVENFKELILEIKENHDYVFIENTPITLINKNNIHLSEINSLMDKTFFIIRSDFVSKIKLINIKETLDNAGVEISGIIINDYGSKNLFEEIERQVNKISFLLPVKLLNKIKEKLRALKYSNQL